MSARVCILWTVFWTVFLITFLSQAVPAVPPPPSVLERWAAEGRLQELATIEREARLKGVNNPTLLTGFRGTRDVVGQRQAIVILVDFDDNEADTLTYPPSHYEEMLFSVGTYPTGSMRDFYQECSYGQLDVVGAAAGWYRMPQDYSYYTDGEYGWGDYPQNAQRMTEDAIGAADPYVDFSQFDNDGPDGIPSSGDDDGYVDALFVVHAGPEGGGGDGWGIWSHAWYTRYPVAVDGVFAHMYSMEPEPAQIGVFCHELGHVLGLPDLYDVDYSSAGLGTWSAMSGGAQGASPVHFDAWCKTRLGWVDPVIVDRDSTGVQILPADSTPVSYKLWTDGNPGDEYFLIEYRRRQNFDGELPWKGLLVYHVDENAPDNDSECCGAGSPHCKVALEQADGNCDLENNLNHGDLCDPFPGFLTSCDGGHTTFEATSSPDSRDYAGIETGVALRNVVIGGGVVTLDIEVQGVTAVGDPDPDAVQSELRLHIPCPFEPGSSIRFSIPHSSDGSGATRARLALYDVRGRLVRTLMSTTRLTASGDVRWDALDSDADLAPSGVYFALLEVGERRIAKKLLLTR